jgi:hypothetical protein
LIGHLSELGEPGARNQREVQIARQFKRDVVGSASEVVIALCNQALTVTIIHSAARHPVSYGLPKNVTFEEDYNQRDDSIDCDSLSVLFRKRARAWPTASIDNAGCQVEERQYLNRLIENLPLHCFRLKSFYGVAFSDPFWMPKQYCIPSNVLM